MSFEFLVRRRWAYEEFLIAKGVSAKLVAPSGLKYAGPVGPVATAARSACCSHAAEQKYCRHAGLDLVVPPGIFDPCGCVLPERQDQAAAALLGTRHGARRQALVQKSSEAIDNEQASATEALKRAICKCLEDEHAAKVCEGATWPAAFGGALCVAETACPGPQDLRLPGADVAASPSSASEDTLTSARLWARELVRPPAVAPLASSVAGRPWPCRAGAGGPQEPSVPARPPRAVLWCTRSTQALSDREHRALLDDMDAEARRLESITFESEAKLDQWLCEQERGADVVPWAVLVVGWREAKPAINLVEAVATGWTGLLRQKGDRNLRPITGPQTGEVNTAVSSIIVLAEGHQQCQKAAEEIARRVSCGGPSKPRPGQQQRLESSSAWKFQVGSRVGLPKLCTVDVLLAHDLDGLRAALRTAARGVLP